MLSSNTPASSRRRYNEYRSCTRSCRTYPLVAHPAYTMIDRGREQYMYKCTTNEQHTRWANTCCQRLHGIDDKGLIRTKILTGCTHTCINSSQSRYYNRLLSRTIMSRNRAVSSHITRLPCKAAPHPGKAQAYQIRPGPTTRNPEYMKPPYILKSVSQSPYTTKKWLPSTFTPISEGAHRCAHSGLHVHHSQSP